MSTNTTSTPRTDELRDNLMMQFLSGKDLKQADVSNAAFDFASILETKLSEANQTIDSITKDPNYEGGTYYWICKHDKMMDSVAKLLVENATLQSSLEEMRRQLAEMTALAEVFNKAFTELKGKV